MKELVALLKIIILIFNFSPQVLKKKKRLSKAAQIWDMPCYVLVLEPLSLIVSL